jgi:hypothetical protein
MASIVPGEASLPCTKEGVKCGGRCLPLGERRRSLTASLDLEGVVERNGSALGSRCLLFRSRGLRLCGDLLTRKTLSLSMLSARGDKKRSGDENQLRAFCVVSAQLIHLLRTVLPRTGDPSSCRILFQSSHSSLRLSLGIAPCWRPGSGLRVSEDMDRVVVLAQNSFSKEPQQEKDTDERYGNAQNNERSVLDL